MIINPLYILNHPSRLLSIRSIGLPNELEVVVIQVALLVHQVFIIILFNLHPVVLFPLMHNEALLYLLSQQPFNAPLLPDFNKYLSLLMSTQLVDVISQELSELSVLLIDILECFINHFLLLGVDLHGSVLFLVVD